MPSVEEPKYGMKSPLKRDFSSLERDFERVPEKQDSEANLRSCDHLKSDLEKEMKMRFKKVYLVSWGVIFTLYAILNSFSLGTSQSSVLVKILGGIFSPSTLIFSGLTYLPIFLILRSEVKLGKVKTSLPSGYIEMLYTKKLDSLMRILLLWMCSLAFMYFMNFVYSRKPIIIGETSLRMKKVTQLNLEIAVIFSYSLFLAFVSVGKDNLFMLQEELSPEVEVSTFVIFRSPFLKILKNETKRSAKLFALYLIPHFFIGDTVYRIFEFLLNIISNSRLELFTSSASIFLGYRFIKTLYIGGILFLSLITVISNIFKEIIWDSKTKYLPEKIDSLVHVFSFPEDSYERYLAFRKLVHLAKYDSNFQAEIYNSGFTEGETFKNMHKEIVKGLRKMIQQISDSSESQNDEANNFIKEGSILQSNAKLSKKKKINENYDKYSRLYMYLAQRDLKDENTTPDQYAYKNALRLNMMRIVYKMLDIFGLGKIVIAKNTHRNWALCFSGLQTSVWSIRFLAEMIYHADSYYSDIVNEYLPEVLTLYMEAFVAVEKFINRNLQSIHTTVNRTSYSENAIYKSNILKDTLEISIYRLTGKYYPLIRNYSFPAEFCDKFQVFANFRQ